MPIEGANLETKLLKIKARVKAEILLPWPTELRFETGIFKRVWPPLQPTFNPHSSQFDHYSTS